MSVIDSATNAVTATVRVGILPGGVAVSPDGSKVYVADENSGTVSVIATPRNIVTATIRVGTNPWVPSFRVHVHSPQGTVAITPMFSRSD